MKKEGGREQVTSEKPKNSVSVRHRSNGITGHHKIVEAGKCYIVLQIVLKHSNIFNVLIQLSLSLTLILLFPSVLRRCQKSSRASDGAKEIAMHENV